MKTLIAWLKRQWREMFDTPLIEVTIRERKNPWDKS